MDLRNTVYDAKLIESLQDIGKRLQSIRLVQELDLKAIAERTNIPIKHLAAIEAGALESLPELVYVRGFVRRYAQALKQDVASFDLGAVPMVQPSKRRFLLGQKISLGAFFKKAQYPLYVLGVAAVGSGLIYLNNRELSPTPGQSAVETPVITQTALDKS